MPLYSATANPPCLDVGRSFTMFDGTEIPSVGLKSIAFARGAQGSDDGGTTFDVAGMPVGMTIDVQVTNTPVGPAQDASFTSVQTLVRSGGSPDSGNSAYTDIGRSAFYRLYVSAYISGAMPVAVAQR